MVGEPLVQPESTAGVMVIFLSFIRLYHKTELSKALLLILESCLDANVHKKYEKELQMVWV